MGQLKRLLWTLCIIALLIQKGEGRSRKQKDIIRLLSRIDNKDCIKLPHSDNAIEIGLDRKEIFTVFNGDHLADAKKLYTHFINANSYEDFYERAVWARHNINGGLFVYAFSITVLQSTYTRDIILPPFYEINPYYFMSGNVMEEANRAEDNHTIIDVDVSTDDIRYFTEDVGINSYYYYINLLLPFWKHDNEYPVRYRNGEYYLHLHQQLLARYNLERYALGLNTTPSFDYEHPIKLGYHSDLVYPNGVAFPSREDNSEIAFRDVLDFEMTNDTYINAYTYLKDFEKSLRDLIQSKNGMGTYKLLTERMGLNSQTEHAGKFNYARIMLGNPTKTSTVPSALEHYETSLRDPMFWPMIKRMLYFYNQFSNRMAPYTSKTRDCHNYCPEEPVITKNIFISNVTIDDLETYFENYTIDLVNGVTKEYCDYFDVRANTTRLNHKPFSYTITLETKEPTVFVKVFIGPKYDDHGRQLTLKQSRFSFVEIDRFIYKHTSFIDSRTKHEYNEMIKRYSFENNLFSDDRTRFHEFYKRVIDGFIEGEDYEISSQSKYYGFPKRFMLPKGSLNGTKFQLYVIAISSTPEKEARESFILNNAFDYNYPFNRPIENDQELLGPNTHLSDITIYHKD